MKSLLKLSSSAIVVGNVHCMCSAAYLSCTSDCKYCNKCGVRNTYRLFRKNANICIRLQRKAVKLCVGGVPILTLAFTSLFGRIIFVSQRSTFHMNYIPGAIIVSLDKLYTAVNRKNKFRNKLVGIEPDYILGSFRGYFYVTELISTTVWNVYMYFQVSTHYLSSFLSPPTT